MTANSFTNERLVLKETVSSALTKGLRSKCQFRLYLTVEMISNLELFYSLFKRPFAKKYVLNGQIY